jgi:hypothetical protein
MMRDRCSTQGRIKTAAAAKPPRPLSGIASDASAPEVL